MLVLALLAGSAAERATSGISGAGAVSSTRTVCCAWARAVAASRAAVTSDVLSEDSALGSDTDSDEASGTEDGDCAVGALARRCTPALTGAVVPAATVDP